MRKPQAGMTFIGALLLTAFVGLFVFAGIRLIPLYLEYMNVAKALDSLKTEVDPGSTSQAQIKMAVEKRFDVNDVTSVTAKDVEITRDNGVWTVRAVYDAPVPFVGNVSFVVHFDKSVALSGPPGGV